MPKLTSYTRQAQASGGQNVISASAGSAGVALQRAGADVTAFTNQLKDVYDKRSITDARAGLADFKVQFADKSIQRQNDAPLSSGYFDREKLAYDQAQEEFLSGISPVARDALAAEMGTHRSSTLTGALRFQAQETVNADTLALTKIRTSLDAEVYSGRVTVHEATDSYSTALDGTTLGTSAQADSLTKALPAFRSQLTSGLLAQPQRGLAALNAGALDFLPKEELDKFEKDLEDVFNGLEERATKQRLASSIDNNTGLYGKYTDGNLTFEELGDAFKNKQITPEFHNILFDGLKGQITPKRTLDEQMIATAELSAVYSEFKIKMQNGKQEHKASLEDILRFNNQVAEKVAGGYLSASKAMTWMNRTQGIAQELAGDSSGTGWIKFNESAFDRGMDAIKVMKLDPAPMGQVLQKFQSLLEESGLADQPDNTERNDKVRGLIKEAHDDYVRSTVPSVAALTDVPNGVLRSNGNLLPGLIGSRDLKPDRTITTNTIVMADANGNYARVSTLANGEKVVQEITQAQALSLGAAPPKPEVTSTPVEGGATAPIPGADTVSTPVGEPTSTRIEGGATAAIPGADTVSTPTSEPTSTPVEGGATAPIPGAEIDATAIVFGNLLANEGEGDKVTGTPTGRLGVTDARKLDAEKTAGRPLSDEDAARQILHDDSALLHNDMAGFSTLNHKVQAAILDLSYNVGVDKVADSLRFPALARAVATGDVPSILLHTLDTAVVDGKTVKGLAGRRARMYNSAVSDSMDKIVSVEQAPDGTIIYNAAPSETAASYVLSKFTLPPHKDSIPGTLSGPNFSPSSTNPLFGNDRISVGEGGGWFDKFITAINPISSAQAGPAQASTNPDKIVGNNPSEAERNAFGDWFDQAINVVKENAKTLQAHAAQGLVSAVTPTDSSEMLTSDWLLKGKLGIDVSRKVMTENDIKPSNLIVLRSLARKAMAQDRTSITWDDYGTDIFGAPIAGIIGDKGVEAADKIYPKSWMGFLKLGVATMLDPEVDMAMTIGQGSLQTDKNGNVILTDTYDIERFKKGSASRGIYGSVRNHIGQEGQVSLESDPDSTKIKWRINLGKL